MTDTEIAQLVTRGANLAVEVKALEEKKEDLDAIKKTLRELAGGKEKTFQGEHGESATVKPTGTAIARSISGDKVKRILKLAGDRVWEFFQLAPIPGKQLEKKDLRVQLLSDLHKAKAQAIIDLVEDSSTGRVSFELAPAK